MAQSVPPNNAPRVTPPAASASDLDMLLQSLQADVPTPPPAAAPSAARQTPSPDAARQQSEATAQRVQTLMRAIDVLHKQVSEIAAQRDTINSIAEAHATDAKALADLQRNMRYLRQIIVQQSQQQSAPSASASNLPPLQVKLLLGHLVEQYHQAERDASTLMYWAMLFIGATVGMSTATGISIWFGASTAWWIFVTSAIVTLFVALIFGGLARGAKSRATFARRVMDESTLLRSIGIQPVTDSNYR